MRQQQQASRRAVTGAFFLAIQIIACIIVLLLSKHEKAHVPLRAFIVGQLCGCAWCLILLFNDRLSQSFQAISDCLQIMLGLFSMGWLIAGCVWVN